MICDPRGVKTSPGVVRMSCMIWEPRPIVTRVFQDIGFVYNSETLRTLPIDIPTTISLLEREPSTLFLRPKYVYRDTFIKAGTDYYSYKTDDLKDLKGRPMFTGSTPNFPWIYHQTFSNVGSIFDSSNIKTPQDIANVTGMGLRSDLAEWTHKDTEVAYAKDGSEDFDGKGIVDKMFAATRATKRIMPIQTAVTTDCTNCSSSSASAKSIHWVVEKDEPLFQGEDFFVEFFRYAYAPNISSTNDPMLPTYAFLDPSAAPVTENGNTFLVNGGVVDVDSEGVIDDSSRDTLSASQQPYFFIEIGKDDPDHHYIIWFAYNSNPVFMHVGKSPVYINAKGDNPPRLYKPATLISRKLSVYELSCKELFRKESFRVTVRNHLGRIIITFMEHEDKPWIIDRQDFDIDRYTDQTQQQQPSIDTGVAVDGTMPNDVPTKTIKMIVPETKMRIGGGNAKSGFMFGPLHYEEFAVFDLPDSICVRGPIVQKDINCLLREKSQKLNDRNKPSSRYFQDAQIYVEIVDGVRKLSNQLSTLTRDEKKTYKGLNNDVIITDPINVIGPDGNLSFIEVAQTSPLKNTAGPGTGGTGDSPTGGTAPTQPINRYIKWFNAQYVLGSGDFTMAKNDPLKKWKIRSCITPIADGWRLAIKANNETPDMCPIDVAHHVQRFSTSWTYTDDVKVEHTGNLTFLLNFGEQTGTFANQSGNPGSAAGDGSTDCNPPQDPTTVDYSQYLTTLNDKNFFLRVYAWWDCGYMKCDNSSCPCKRGQTTADKRVVFTGFCHGGEIRIEPGGKRVMECQMFDYMKILQDSQFLNSPFFDGMRDFNAIYEVLLSAGFADVPTSGNHPEKYPPAAYAKLLSDAALMPGLTDPMHGVIPYVGESFTNYEYALPASYDLLQSPAFKFSDGSKLEEAINKIAQLAGKMYFFDQYGVFRYDQRPDRFKCLSSTLQKARCNFFASPKDVPSGRCHEYDVLALNAYTYKRYVADVVNEIHMLTTTPNGETIIGSSVNLPGKYDPNAPGYIGYTKRLLQTDGIFGSEDALRKLVKYYEGFYIPPIMVTWESMGISHLRAGDTVSFTGLQLDNSFPPNNRTEASLPGGVQGRTVSVYITNMSLDIDAEHNTWTNKYEGEWIFFGGVDSDCH